TRQRQRVDDADRAGAGGERGLEHVGARQVAARRLERALGLQLERAAALPVDGAVARHQRRRAAIADQGIVLDRRVAVDPAHSRSGFGRMFAARMRLRSRMLEGVTSTSSSSLMNSIACSRPSLRGGIRRIASSALEARMLVCFFSLVTLTSMSAVREFSPMIIPS